MRTETFKVNKLFLGVSSLEADSCAERILGDVSHVCVTFEFDAENLLGKMERATGIEPATSSLGIKITAPLFSTLTKPPNKNMRACTAYRACAA
jgi:hypothetical protein